MSRGTLRSSSAEEMQSARHARADTIMTDDSMTA